MKNGIWKMPRQSGNKATVTPTGTEQEETRVDSLQDFGNWIARMNGPRN
jgi:hypothetical protein